MCFFQDAAPVRLKGAHYLNTPMGFETIFNIAKNFLNEKNKQRVRIINQLNKIQSNFYCKKI